MGNGVSSYSPESTSGSTKATRSRHSKNTTTSTTDNVATRASRVMGDVQAGLSKGMKSVLDVDVVGNEDDDNQEGGVLTGLLDTVCGVYLNPTTTASSSNRKDATQPARQHKQQQQQRNNHKKKGVRSSSVSEDASDDYYSEEETTVTTDYPRHKSRRRRRGSGRGDASTLDDSFVSNQGGGDDDPSYYDDCTEDYDEDEEEEDDDTYTQPSRVTTATSEAPNGRSLEDEDDDPTAASVRREVQQLSAGSGEARNNNMYGRSALLRQPLASSFAKRCYFTKAGIGNQTQHYEGLTLTGNVVLMLAQAMKLKGCPTICDEDLRRVEQTYPNQFSRLPDELLLSSGWRRISKYCHFSHKAIPDGVPFFHSRQRLHPNGGYYFLLAAAVGMMRPVDVEPLMRDTLVLLETDYPQPCDAAPPQLIQDPSAWTVVDKFCFFSGGPINTEEDVYYEADFDGNPIFMLAFLSPSLTPAELYKLQQNEPPLASVAAVHEVESVYDLTERDFDDLKLYHLGPCRALPQYILQPQAWTKVLPPHFLAAREAALHRALEFEPHHHPASSEPASPYYAGDQHPQHHNGHNYLSSQKHQQQQHIQSPYGHSVSPSDPYHQQQQSPSPMDPPHSPYASHHSGSIMSLQQQQQHQQHYRSPQSHHQPSSASDYYDPTISGSEFYSRSRGGSGMEEDEYGGDCEYDNSYLDGMPMDEAIAAHASTTRGRGQMGSPVRMDPPEDQPPRLSLRQQQHQLQYSGSGGGGSEDIDPYDVSNTTSVLYPREPADPVADRGYPVEPYYRNPSPPGQSRGDTFSEPEEDDDNDDPPQQQYRHHHPSVDRDYPSEEYSDEHEFHPDDIVDEEENGVDDASHPHHYSAAQSPEEYGRYDDDDDDDFRHQEPSDEYDGQEGFHSRDMDDDNDEYDERNHYRASLLNDDFDDEDRVRAGRGHYGMEEHPVGPPHYPQGYGTSQSPDGGCTEFSIPSVSQSGMISRGQFTYTSGSLEVSPDNSARDFMDSSPTNNAAGSSSIHSGWNGNHLPPPSPHSVNSSNNNDSHYSPSSVTRGAQEFLRRRNRQRRAMQQASTATTRPQQQQLPSPGETSVSSAESPPPGDPQPSSGAAPVVVESASSGGYWESGSARSEFSGTGSSVWMSGNATEEDGALSHGGGDARSSRRALILQMAKARMKSQVHPDSSGAAAAANAVTPQLEDEKKDSLDVLSSDGMDFTNDLD